MKVPIWVIPVVTIALLFGSWGVGKATGEWEISGRQQVLAGQQITADDIRGWMTIQQAADGLGIAPEEIIALLDAPQGAEVTPQTAFKDLEALVPGFEVSTFRDILRAYLSGAPTGASPDPGHSSSAPSAAAGAPTRAPTGIPTGTSTSRGEEGTPTGTGAPGSGSTQAITGQMTLQQVAVDNGLDVQDLVAEAGLPADIDPGTTLKDIKNIVPGFEVQVVRDAVARLTAQG